MIARYCPPMIPEPEAAGRFANPGGNQDTIIDRSAGVAGSDRRLVWISLRLPNDVGFANRLGNVHFVDWSLRATGKHASTEIVSSRNCNSVLDLSIPFKVYCAFRNLRQVLSILFKGAGPFGKTKNINYLVH